MAVPFSVYFSLEHVMPRFVKARLEAARNRHYPLPEGGVLLRRGVTTAKSAAEAERLFRDASMPVLWKQGAADTALAGWNLKHLESVAGKTPVKILSLPGLGGEAEDYSDQVMPLAGYIALLKKRKVYLRFSDLLENSPALRSELPLALLGGLGGNPRRVNLQFFLGPEGTQTPLHAEMNCNIFVQVFGRKRWVVFPPSAAKRLQPPSAGRFYFFSPLKPLAYGRRKPASGALEGTEIILEPGDILLCPPLVWHAVENLTLSCSVGFKYNRYLQAFRASPMLFSMNALARNPSYFTYLWHAFVRKRHPILATK